MNIVKEQLFRSEGRKINQTDDMVRVTVDFTVSELREFKKNKLMVEKSNHDCIIKRQKKELKL